MSCAELYVHAIAIEREAAKRYGELACAMREQGSRALAAFFAMLAGFEARHLEELKARTAGLELPPLEADYSWLIATEPCQTEREALVLALQAEKRAHAFFEHAARVADEPAVRALAREMAAEEAEHMAFIGRAMASRTNMEKA